MGRSSSAGFTGQTGGLRRPRSVGHPVFAAADGEENSRTNAMCPSPRKKNTCQATAQHKQPAKKEIPGLAAVLEYLYKYVHISNIRTNIGLTLTPAKVPHKTPRTPAEPTPRGGCIYGAKSKIIKRWGTHREVPGKTPEKHNLFIIY